MPNVVHLLNAAGHLDEIERELRDAAEDAVRRSAARLDLDGVDVAVYASLWTLPKTGVLGYAPLPHFVQITLTPSNPNFETSWRAEVPATIAHEHHHAKRWRGPAYGRTLLEALVSEGLAQHFEVQERGGPPPYARVNVDVEALWERAQSDLDRTEYGHDAWFFGASDLPRWAGYTLGFELVRRFFEQTGQDAVSAVWIDARAVRGAFDRPSGRAPRGS